MRKQKYHLLSGGLTGLFVLLLCSCYPSGPTNILELNLVVTFNDAQFNFASVRTYALPETVFDLPGSDQVNHEYDSLILEAVDNNMTALGYVREIAPEQNGADVVLVVSVSRQTIIYGDFSWYSYWGAWPGWEYWGPWDAGWGLYFSWPVGQTFTTGSIFIEMVDPKAKDSHGTKLPVRWTGIINAALSTSAAATSAQVVSSVDQCFAQSPYLAK